MKNEVFLMLISAKSLQNTSGRVIKILRKDFVFLMKVHLFLNFFSWGNISQYGILKQIMKNAPSLFITQLAWGVY